MRQSIIFGGIFAFVMVLISLYFLVPRNNENDLLDRRTKLQTDLVVAQKKLGKARETLDAMKGDLRKSFPLGASVQEQMQKGSSIVGQTDFMFTDANGLKPELIVKNLPEALLINKKRREINILLLKWQGQSDILFITKIDSAESAQIKQDAATIQTYLNDLTRLVGILTPKNSGLTQHQIDNYLATLPSSAAINEVLGALQTAIDNSKNISPVVTTQTGGTSTSGGNAPVSVEDVAAQQSAVDQAQEEVNAIQEELNQVQTQIDKNSSDPNNNSNSDSGSNTSPVSDSGSSTPTDQNNGNIFVPNPGQSNSGGQTTPGATNPGVTPTDPNTGSPAPIPVDNSVDENFDRNDHSGIIIQPGPPRLIQGSNQY